jgi:transposase
MSYLSGRCHDGRRVVEEFVGDVLGVPLSLGTVSAGEAEVCDALAEPHEQARRSVAGAAAKNVDETGWKVAGRRHWLWVAATRAAAVFAVHAGRGWDGLAAVLGRDPCRAGVVTSDRFPAYDGLPVDGRQVCWAHLLRDFTRFAEPGGHTGRAMVIGSDGRAVAKKVLGLWRDFRERRVGLPAVRAGLARLRARMGQVLRAGAKLAGAADAKAAALCRNLLAIEPALWTFAGRAGADVEPTNNHAERMLRPAVLWRKNSFGCQSDGGCRFAERMLTAVQTLRLRGKNVLDFLTRAVAALRAGQPAPSLLA